MFTPPEASEVRRRAPPFAAARPSILSAEQSALARDRLLAELGALQSNDEAASWAHRSLPAKNTLTVADAQLVEDGFRINMAALAVSSRGAPRDGQNPFRGGIRPTESGMPQSLQRLCERTAIRRGRVAAKTIRLRDKDHRKFVATSHAWSAAAHLPMLTICVLPSLGARPQGQR